MNKYFLFIIIFLGSIEPSYGLGFWAPRRTPRPPTGPVQANITTPVILVHGFLFEYVNSLATIRRKLIKNGYPSRLLFTFKMSNSLNCVEVSADELNAYIESVRSQTQSEKVHIIAHSLGGLVTRYYLKAHQGFLYTDRFVSIASPHQGSLSSHFAAIGGCPIAQAIPDSQLLRYLNQPSQVFPEVKYATLTAFFDVIITPSSNARLNGVENKEIFADHLSIVHHPQALNFIVQKIMY